MRGSIEACHARAWGLACLGLHQGEPPMTKCRRYVWIVWISVGLTLVLSRCGPPEVQSVPPAAPPRTLASPMPALPALRVGLAPQYPPIAFTQDGRVTGLEVDCAHGVAGELGRQVTFIELDWDALIPALEAGQIDIIMSGMSITDARAQRVWFVSPYLGDFRERLSCDRVRLPDESPSISTSTHFERFCHVPARLCACIA